ncbi:hypothetical protein GLAREA_01013 [Glarea lozoyensis ATCC 20868]|uniref:Uncharacterized protein n=1 Tax=Glarea lozoyensis (strain ATCC 20868 / MF5171) TaxID=1116229 RepID=S3DTY8_GLAL2|nr:uncharacterized protein GLAREA_01013 [Glarea lozoyensis ATCC 20868]EPE29853.1 hypothetical protein GLAREA_01013 [Glarea lozoyensis ATCC 20868]
MACPSVDCSFNSNSSLAPPALEPNPDISGTGVLIGFVGTAYITLGALILRYLIGLPEDTSIDDQPISNPVDDRLLKLIWRKVGRPPERWAQPLKNSVLALSDTQLVTGLSILASGYAQIKCCLSIFHWHIVVFLAWFSSATHLTTITFLRRYIHDNHGLRNIRLILMFFLVGMLVVALIPTGGDCGLFSDSDALLMAYIGLNRTSKLYPGYPAKCCFDRMHDGKFIESKTTEQFLSMIASELVLLSGTIARVIKMHRGPSKWSRLLLRDKPSRFSKSFLARLEKRHEESSSKSIRAVYSVFHCSGVTAIITARAAYDLVESLLWEISWLIFSLAWGTMRLFTTRGLAVQDAAAEKGTKDQVALSENFWGFGQWTPTLLLILPILGYIEGYMDTAKITRDKSLLESQENECEEAMQPSNDRSRESFIVGTGSHSIEGRVSQETMIQLHEMDITSSMSSARRTGTDLSLMEYNVGVGGSVNTTNGVISNRRLTSNDDQPPQSPHGSSGDSMQTLPTISRPGLWPSERLFQHDFYSEKWFQELVFALYTVVVASGIQLIAFAAGVGQTTIFTFLQLFITYYV